MSMEKITMVLTSEQIEQVTGGNGFPGGCPDFRRKGPSGSGVDACPHPEKYGQQIECNYCGRKKIVK